MFYRQIIKRCPHCNRVYEEEMVLARQNKYGSPFITCKKCGKEFVDSEYKEIAISGISKEDTKGYSKQMFIALCFMVTVGVFMTVMAVATRAYDVVRIGLFMVILFLALFWFGVDKRKRFLQEETEASKERIKNPKYIFKLKKNGYDFPEKFLYEYFFGDMRQEIEDVSNALKLTVVSTGEVLKYYKTTVGVGRVAKNGMSLDNELISRLHAFFYYEKGKWFLVDNHSTNGTYINDKKLVPNREYQLCKGDIVMFAKEKVVFFEAEKDKGAFEVGKASGMVCVYAPPELMGRASFDASGNNSTYPSIYAFTENKSSTDEADTYMEEVYGSPDMFRKQ